MSKKITECEVNSESVDCGYHHHRLHSKHAKAGNVALNLISNFIDEISVLIFNISASVLFRILLKFINYLLKSYTLNSMNFSQVYIKNLLLYVF